MKGMLLPYSPESLSMLNSYEKVTTIKLQYNILSCVEPNVTKQAKHYTVIHRHFRVTILLCKSNK